MEKFNNIPSDKQNTVINAALEVFGANGYKKTSMNDIAEAAGISKAMVFHYFGTKRKLYYYLLKLCNSLIANEINEKFDSSITDFFERIIMTTTIKMSVVKKHPATLAFLYSVYFESCEEVRGDIREVLAQSEGIRNTIAFQGMDHSKFKDGVDVNLVMKMLTWMGEGFSRPIKNIRVTDLDTMLKDFHEGMYLLRRNLYKEQYL